jgi:TPR repeat protein
MFGGHHFLQAAQRSVIPLVVAGAWSTSASLCQDNHQRKPQRRATLRAASNLPQRFSTEQELSKLRRKKTAMLRQWERDEDGWRELPARAWPAYQPDENQMQEIQKRALSEGCDSKNRSSTLCQTLAFQIATTLVFYQVDPKAGFEQYEALAKQGHVDSMVACGVILVDGIGVPPREEIGIEWLRKAAKLGSVQAVGSRYYIGIDGVLQEDAEVAFEYFEKAATHDHTAAVYMVADCLVEGEGTKRSVAKAVPLFYLAAERGHRYARQRIRELLKENPRKK